MIMDDLIKIPDDHRGTPMGYIRKNIGGRVEAYDNQKKLIGTFNHQDLALQAIAGPIPELRK